jgi:hypothetical protein
MTKSWISFWRGGDSKDEDFSLLFGGHFVSLYDPYPGVLARLNPIWIGFKSRVQECFYKFINKLKNLDKPDVLDACNSSQVMHCAKFCRFLASNFPPLQIKEIPVPHSLEDGMP